MIAWRQVNEILEHALTLEGDARDTYVARTCAENPALENAVRALLRADRSASQFWGEFEASPLAPPAEEVIGRSIGPYRLLRVIGQGGMSTVYLARRDDDFNREVALKVIRRDMESADAERRLRAEREILAHLDHPFIARLFDGGTTDAGLPYVVMEHIEGERIDTYCDQHALNVDDRLRLFLSILDAVRYAHQNLIVHRDLKPSNILVTANGTPKLLDFGISKVLNANVTAGTSADADSTAAWMRVLTPSHASPEQISGGPIATTSDIYSLGVLLFSLLCGELPHRVAGRTPAEIEALLRDEPPPKPSDALAKGSDQAARAAARQTQPRRLRERLRGDLDAIVTRAIQPSPMRRYGSAEQLADDLHRHLAGEPVLARSEGWLYRAGKLVRRRARWFVGGLVLLAILSGLVTRLARQNQLLATERTLVARERDASARVLTFTERLLGSADPSVARAADWTVADALRHSESLIDDELADEPDVQARLHGIVGRVFRGLGDSEAAIEHLDKAHALTRQLNGADSLLAAGAASDLAAALVGTGDFVQAERLAHEAVETYRERTGLRDPASVTALNTFVFALCADGDFASAEDASAEALRVARALLPPTDADLAHALHNRAHVLNQRGDVEAAEALYREVLALREANLGAPHPAIASTQVNLAANLDRQGKTTDAKRLYQQALGHQRQLFGERHPDLAPTLNNLAVVHQALEQWAEAEASYREAIALFPDGDIQHLRFRTELAALLDRTGRSSEAEAMLRAELTYWRTKLPPGNTLVAWAENTLGAVLTGQGRLNEATPLLERSLPLILARRGPNDAYTRKAERRLATLQAAKE